MLLLLVLFSFLSLSHSAVLVDSTMKTFGGVLKNSPLEPNNETTIFQHTAPSGGTITLLHFPAVMPTTNWGDTLVRVYVDNEITAGLEFTLFALAALSPMDPSGANDGAPWGHELFGHTASGGGVYSTIRIPFGKTIEFTLQLPDYVTEGQIFWSNVRGVENLPVILGDLQLPRDARLKLYKQENVSVDPFGFLTSCTIKGTAGAVLGVILSGNSTDYNYLEACLRCFIDDSESGLLFLSSGTEDYFLSAYYFDLGKFTTSESGLTLLEGDGAMTAYKTHLRDPILFNSYFQFLWRNEENVNGTGDFLTCPNVWGTSEIKTNTNTNTNPTSFYSKQKNKSFISAPKVAPAIYSSYVWVYQYASVPPPLTSSSSPSSPSSLLSSSLSPSSHILVKNMNDLSSIGFLFFDSSTELLGMPLEGIRKRINEELELEKNNHYFYFMKNYKEEYVKIFENQESKVKMEEILVAKEGVWQLFIQM